MRTIVSCRGSRGASWLWAALVLFSLMGRPAAAHFPPLEWFYTTCHGSFADSMGSSMAIFFIAVPIAGACGAVLLLPDIGYKIAHPETKMGHYSNAVCIYPAGASLAAAYAVFGAPFFAAQWLFWDAFFGPCPPDWRSPPKPPQPQPAENE